MCIPTFIKREIASTPAEMSTAHVQQQPKAKNKTLDTGGGRVFLDVSSGLIWPRAGAFGARAILRPCAQLVGCESYVMKDLQKKKSYAVQVCVLMYIYL